jgi:hypothetical protein
LAIRSISATSPLGMASFTRSMQRRRASGAGVPTGESKLERSASATGHHTFASP